MSGQEEQQQQQQQPVGEHHHDDNVERFVDLMMLASAPPPRGPNLLDYLYYHGVPISVSPFQRVGGVANNPNDIESTVASILSRSLYDRHPVKKVITEEARCEIVDKKFTAAMVEELKINGVCGIWQEDFEEGEGIKILQCNHAFKADAIMKWLEEEKAECPVCRFSLKSKEVNENQNFDDGDDDEDEEDEEGEGEDEVPNNEPEPAAEPAQDNDAVRVNNIASRLVQSVAGRVSGRINHPSFAMPMNQFLQSVRMMSSSSRPREPMRAAIPSASGAAPAPNSQAAYANAGREVRAEALANNNNNNNNNNNYNNLVYNINYNYINNYNNNNNNNNNYNDDEDVVLNQEQADIEEAIRRSLEQI
jgi:hypothetical protein